ncbi:MAG: cell wall-binding repeat-containing protein [Actinomycetota bacterium]|nr:cell wall-binding repeat-containing protein [Actinomycetota bacterium]
MSALPTPRRLLPRLLIAAILLLTGPGLLAGTSAGALAQPAAPTQADADGTAAPTAGDVGFSVQRLAGSDRYGTAARISRTFFSPGAPVAFVVTAASFPDGLSAGPAGARLGGPVLFTDRSSLPSATRTELTRLRPGRIVVVGGTGVISEAVRTELATLTTGRATRVSGNDRYQTAAALSRHAYPSGSSIAYVATGRSFPDALAGGAAAGIQSAPMLLTDTSTLPESTRAELVRLDPDRIMLLGGTGAVSSSVAGQLAQIATTERVQGDDRYDTALAISQRVFGTGRPGVMMATGRSWPDALAASPAVSTTRGPILLSTGTSLPSGTTSELRRLGPTTAYLLGGDRAQSANVAKQVQRTLGVCWAGTRPATGSAEVFSSVPGAGKQVAFTLDMGGRIDPALDIVNYLIDNQVCTTFFPTSAMASTTEGKKVMARIAAHPELFELGNHTVHHCDLVNGGLGSPTTAPCDRDMTRTFIRSELTTAETTLEGMTGMPVNPYWRPPYGAHNAFVREAATSVGHTKTVMWNRDTIDWHPDTTTSQIVNRVVSPLPPNGTIVLAHMGGYRTYNALPQIVSTLRANGYTLTTVSDMRDG